tara:strand:+ start:1560 stop:1796 length:237 start_codon:yes stop_codon:yes gene_type:complete
MSPKKEETLSYTKNKKDKKRYVYLEKFERTKDAIKSKFDNQDLTLSFLEKKINMLIGLVSVLAAFIIVALIRAIVISI